MSILKRATKGVQQRPFLIGIHGGAGVGKTTFASNAPNPIFLATEDGTDQMDVTRVKIKNFLEMKQVIRELYDDKEFKTVVIDSVDHLETMIHDMVAHEHSVDSIGKIGYGKGYEYAMAKWNNLMQMLQQLREHGKNVILIAHSQMKKFNDPIENEQYDRFELKLHAKASAFITESMDALMFAKHEVLVKKDSNTQRVKTMGDGSRVLFTEERPAFDAKNRFGLPPEMPLSWNEFEKYALKSNNQKCVDYIERIQSKLDEINDDEYSKKVLDWVEKNKTNLSKLEETLTRINER